jgi:hypothetical protein
MSNRNGWLKMLPAKTLSFRITTKHKIWQLNVGRYKLNCIKSKLQQKSYSEIECRNIPCNFTEFGVGSNIKSGCYVKIWVLFPTPKLDTNPGSFIIFEWPLPGALTALICPAGVTDRKTLTGLCQREMDFKAKHCMQYWNMSQKRLLCCKECLLAVRASCY